MASSQTVTSQTVTSQTATSFGSVLKQWRATRRMSQLDLSSAAEVSTRHISFLESGRSRPSRPMVVHLAETLDVPLADRNRLLTAAGFAPMWQSRDLATPEMAPVHDAMRWTLDRHNPYPAVVMDRHWSVLYENQAATMMFDLLGLERPIDFLTEMTQPDGVRQIIDNWAEVGRYLLGRLRTESVAIGGDEQLDAAIDLLRADPEVGPPVSAQPPFVTLDFRLDDLCLSLLSTIAQFGTAEDLTLSEARIELFFPADDATREFLESLAS